MNILNFSCNTDDTNTSPVTTDTSATTLGKMDIRSSLPFFYLDNYKEGEDVTHSQLYKLREKKAEETDKDKKKLVFTYFSDSTNVITLAAWASLRAKEGGQYDERYIKLNAGTEVALDLRGRNLPLANFEIRNQGKGKKYLNVLFSDTVVNNPKYKYIIFEPCDTCSTSNAIYYKIHYTGDTAGKDLKTLPTMDINVNPSPPKDAY